MMRNLLILILIFLLLACASSRPWTKTEKTMLLASFLAAGADYYTAEKDLDDQNCHENNPLIGRHPTDIELTIKGWGFYGIFVLIAHYWPEMRPGLLGCQIAYNAGWTIHNIKED